jgi:hypothetical protein
VVIWSGLLNSQNLLRKTTAEASRAARLIQLDTYFRKSVRRVLLPFWLKGNAILQEKDRLVIPWLDGDARQALTLERRGAFLIIGPQGEESPPSFGPFREVAFEPMAADGGRIEGIRVTLAGDDSEGRRIILSARFGGVPLD